LGLLIASAGTYVASAWWIVNAYPAAVSSPLSSTFLGVAITMLLFLMFIGFFLRQTNIIESSGWLCGFDQELSSDPSYSHVPLLSNLIPHLQALLNFVTNMLPKPVLVALLYWLTVLQLASKILPGIGADSPDDAEGHSVRTWIITGICTTTESEPSHTNPHYPPSEYVHTLSKHRIDVIPNITSTNYHRLCCRVVHDCYGLFIFLRITQLDYSYAIATDSFSHTIISVSKVYLSRASAGLNPSFG
ncbi:uncharacterized protein EV420DRAFT_1276588, partial [Desarmillaria tabescens]